MTRGKKLLICFAISLCVVTLQFTLDRREHLRLASNGRITDAASSYSKEWSGDYAHFKFTSSDGQHIEHSEIWERNPLRVDLWSREVLWQKLQYMHQNPVRAGVCQWPQEYYWSSAAFYQTGIDNFGWL
ncbi:MAG TPA: hypothetical protein VNT20_00685, partial [Flavisolibacter sp.]|nr:hypothetical protein [Flavisolibacter sp.]